jgi:spore coat polysaccharide biosynthesis protein SpsF
MGDTIKTAIFIPVRISSTRLLNKPLLKIKGKTVIEHLIDRMKSAKLPDVIVLCTTTNQEDKKLVNIAKKNKIEYFRGSEKDIIKRFFEAAMKYDIDFIVNVDGDDILCDPEYVDKTIDIFLKNNPDVIKWEGLPFGAAPLGIKVGALKKVYSTKDVDDTETGWGLYFTENKLFNVEILQADSAVRYPDIRMSLDYPEDFDFFNKIFEELYVPGKTMSLLNVITFLRRNPQIIRINTGLQKKYLKRFKKMSVKLKSKTEA